MQISAEIGEKMTPPSALVMTSRLIINDWEFVEINLFFVYFCAHIIKYVQWTKYFPEKGITHFYFVFVFKHLRRRCCAHGPNLFLFSSCSPNFSVVLVLMVILSAPLLHASSFHLRYFFFFFWFLVEFCFSFWKFTTCLTAGH